MIDDIIEIERAKRGSVSFANGNPVSNEAGLNAWGSSGTSPGADAPSPIGGEGVRDGSWFRRLFAGA